MFHLIATANKTKQIKKVNKVNVNNNGMYKLKLTVRKRRRREKVGEEVKKKLHD